MKSNVQLVVCAEDGREEQVQGLCLPGEPYKM
jgi:hypothetical protein